MTTAQTTAAVHAANMARVADTGLTPDQAIANIEAGLVLSLARTAEAFFHADELWGAALRAAFGRRATDARYSALGRGDDGSELRALYVARYHAYAAWSAARSLPVCPDPVASVAPAAPAMVPQPCQQQQARARSRFDYSPWRHGGWYVGNVQHPSGAVGCVSRNYPDGKWRIVCDPRPNAHQLHTYRTRDEAAQAEADLITAGMGHGARA